MANELNLSWSQHAFLNLLDTKFKAFVSGMGGGKSFVGCLDLLLFASKHPGTIMAYFAPTYAAIRDIFYPTFEEAAHLLGFRIKVRTAVAEVDMYRNGQYYGTVICRSMNDPSRIVGFKVSRALVDELDIMNITKARASWQKIVARLRLKIDGVENTVGVTTTPEGFRFCYERFAKNPKSRYSMVQASTYENLENLPEDYIESLHETYTPELVKAYVYGQFVNLTHGTVYKNYDRHKNASNENIEGDEDLHIGMDFNVEKQAASVYVLRNGDKDWHAVAELKDMYDTPDAIHIIKEKWPENRIYVYPDASGGSRKTNNASTSDIGLLQQAGFIVKVNKKNPLVKDRVLSMNKCLASPNVFVNAANCPTIAGSLEQQPYDKNGEPDKKGGVDHQNDATTYPIAYTFPINKPAIHIPVSFDF